MPSSPEILNGGRDLRGRAKKRTGWISVPFHERPRRRSVQVTQKNIFTFSECYRPYTGFVQSRGPENIGLQRTIPAASSKSPVQSHLRITLENNGKIRPQPDRENAFARASGGGDDTRAQLSPVPVSGPAWSLRKPARTRRTLKFRCSGRTACGPAVRQIL